MLQEKTMPGYWRFLWMFWMQPLSLHQCLEHLGIFAEEKEQQASLRSMAFRMYLGRCLFVLLVSVLIFSSISFFLQVIFDGRDPYFAINKIMKGAVKGMVLGICSVEKDVGYGAYIGGRNGGGKCSWRCTRFEWMEYI